MGCIEIGLTFLLLLVMFRLTETWDVLKSVPRPTPKVVIMRSNRNMGCIEILFPASCRVSLSGLTETWDVLKFCSPSFNVQGPRCLTETWDVLKFTFVVFTLPIPSVSNRNMGCIEILKRALVWIRRFRLTETWDVLK